MLNLAIPQTLSAMVRRDARQAGIEIGEVNLKRQYQRAIEDLTSTRMVHGLCVVGAGYRPERTDDKTEAMVE